ncbi:hypothetical protein GCM10027299_55830 [Larkinella ripae]
MATGMLLNDKGTLSGQHDRGLPRNGLAGGLNRKEIVEKKVQALFRFRGIRLNGNQTSGVEFQMNDSIASHELPERGMGHNVA